MKRCQILSSVTGKLFSEMTKFKNKRESKENFNKNVLLNIAYITQSLIIKEKVLVKSSGFFGLIFIFVLTIL